MRGSAPQATEYRTDLTALPLIGSIRWLDKDFCHCSRVMVSKWALARCGSNVAG